jgi:hypothetical protein
MCDQFHDGTGFLTHHLALTNSFEVRYAYSSIYLIPYLFDFSPTEPIFMNSEPNILQILDHLSYLLLFSPLLVFFTITYILFLSTYPRLLYGPWTRP